MINDILNGLGVTEVLKPEISAFSKRSGSSTTSRSTTATAGGEVYTLPDGKQYTLTKAQYADFNKVYNEAYGYAYSKNINPPQVKDVLKYGQVVADWYKDGKVFTEANYLASQTQTYSVALPKGQVASNLTQAQYDTVQPPEEKQGSGILIPALIFAVGAIAAIVLVGSKPKRR